MTDLIISQGAGFLLGAGIGIALTLSYDLIRLVRRVVSHNFIITVIEDICFWLVWTCVVWYCLQIRWDGMLHWYMAFGILLGALFYHYTISSILIHGIDYILYRVKKWAKNRKKMLKKSDRKSKM